MKKVLLIIGLVIVALVIGVVLYVGYLGFIPAIASLLGSDQPRDLGITYTEQDYNSAVKKGKVEVKTAEGTKAPKKSFTIKGEQKVDTKFTSEEVTAAINEHVGNWEYYPVSQAQIRVNEDGTIEGSGMMVKSHLEGYARATGATDEQIEAARPYVERLPDQFPMYIHAKASATNSMPDLQLMSFEVGRLNLPGFAFEVVQGVANEWVAQRLDVFGVQIDSAGVEDGKIFFEGKLPDSIQTTIGQ